MGGKISTVPENVIKIDEGSDAKTLGKKYGLSRNAIKGLQQFIEDAKKEGKEDVLYVTKKHLNAMFMNTRDAKGEHLKSNSTIIPLVERQEALRNKEEEITDSYEILQDTQLAKNLAGGYENNIEQGRETLQTFADTLDSMGAQFLFGTHESPLFGADLSWQQKKNLTTGLSFYLSEKVLGDGEDKGKFNKAIELSKQVSNGDWLKAMGTAWETRSDLMELTKPFQTFFDQINGQDKGKSFKEKIEAHKDGLSDPLNAKNMISDIVVGKQMSTADYDNEFSPEDKEKLAEIGGKWEDVITEETGADIAGIAAIINPETNKSMDLASKAKLFFKTSIGEKVKDMLGDGMLMSLISFFCVTFLGFDLNDAMGNNDLSESNISTLRNSVVEIFENINNADELFLTSDNKFDKASASRFESMMKENETHSDAIRRITTSSDFKDIAKELTKGTVSTDGKILPGMDEAISYYYDFQKAKEATPGLAAHIFIKNIKENVQKAPKVDEKNKSQLGALGAEENPEAIAKQETVTQDANKITAITKIQQNAYKTVIGKDGLVTISSSIDGEVPVRYKIMDVGILEGISTGWNEADFKETLQSPEFKISLRQGIATATEVNGKFNNKKSIVLSLSGGLPLELTLVDTRQAEEDNPSSGEPSNTEVASGETTSSAQAATAKPALTVASEPASTTAGTTATTTIVAVTTTAGAKEEKAPELIPASPESAESSMKYEFKETTEINNLLRSPAKNIEKKGSESVTIRINENYTAKVSEGKLQLKTVEGGITTLYEYEGLDNDYTQNVEQEILNTAQWQLSIGYTQVINAITPILSQIDKQIINFGESTDEKTGKVTQYGNVKLVAKYSDEKVEEKSPALNSNETQVTQPINPAKETAKEKEKNNTGFIIYEEETALHDVIKGRLNGTEFKIEKKADPEGDFLYITLGDVTYKSFVESTGMMGTLFSITTDYTIDMRGNEKITFDGEGIVGSSDKSFTPEDIIREIKTRSGEGRFKYSEGPIEGHNLIFRKIVTRKI